jgi:hypothetical protein
MFRNDSPHLNHLVPNQYLPIISLNHYLHGRLMIPTPVLLFVSAARPVGTPRATLGLALLQPWAAGVKWPFQGLAPWRWEPIEILWSYTLWLLWKDPPFLMGKSTWPFSMSQTVSLPGGYSYREL